MRCSVVLLALGLMAVAASSGGAAQASPAVEAASAKPKPRVCRTVVKVVKGKRTKARVCRPAAKRKAKPKPKPTDVSLVLDAARSASAAVGPGGGTVTANAAGGAAFSLSIPAGALQEETRITLTPVSALQGLKGLRLRAGVQFAPDGLALAKPAILSVSTPNVTGSRALAWWEAGEDVSRYPSSRNGPLVRVTVTHFSGVGVASGPASAWDTLLGAEAALRARYQADVKPPLDGAADADPLTSSAFTNAFAWERSVELLGLGGAFGAEKAYIRTMLERAIVNAIARAETRCDEEHDLSQIERLVRLDRQAQLWGFAVPGESGFARAVECARFELDMDFHNAFAADGNAGGVFIRYSGDIRVRAEKVLFELRSTRMDAEQPLSIVSYEATYASGAPQMSCSGQQGPAAATAPFRATLAVDPAGYATRGYPDVSLDLEPGDVDVSMALTCSNGVSVVSPLFTLAAYADLWRQAFADRKDAAGRLRLQVLPPAGQWVGGDVLATYGPETRTIEYAFPSGSASATLTWSFTLRHVPER
jgi:hypothetical protein